MLSHHHKAIFVHIPKCAGQSVEIAFLRDLGLTWRTRAPLLLHPNDRAEFGPPRLAHLLAADYVRYHYVTDTIFQSYLKFAVVRNPWTRVVSLYCHLSRNISRNLTFRKFVLEWLAGQFANQHTAEKFWFVRPQVDFVFADGKLLVDEIVRFERLPEEFDRIAARVGLKTPLPHVNQRRCVGNKRAKLPFWWLHPKRRETPSQANAFYTSETAEMVGRLYAEDAVAFRYAFEN
jgi:hypothetical protein